MQYVNLVWNILKGLGKALLFWRIHKAGEERAELNELEADLEASRRAQAHRDRLRTDGSYSKRLRSHFKR